MPIEDIVAVCSFKDAIKRRGEYFFIGEQLTELYVEEAVRQGYNVSHGYCPPCLKREMDSLYHIQVRSQR